mgnify:CR=1 FL=1
MTIRFKICMDNNVKTVMYSNIYTTSKEDPSLKEVVAELRAHANQLYEDRCFRVPCSAMIRFNYKDKSLLITY